MSKERVILLSVRKWSFKDDKTQRDYAGTTATYLAPYTNTDPERKGHESQSCACDDSLFSIMTDSPCYAEVTFETRPNFKGKAVLTMTGATVQKTLDLFGVSK